MKRLLPYIISGIAIAATFGAVASASQPAFNSSQVGSSAANGSVLQTNGVQSTWIATSSLGISGPSYTATYPVTLTGHALGLAFSTTTANSWSQTQTFAGGALFTNGATLANNNSFQLKDTSGTSHTAFYLNSANDVHFFPDMTSGVNNVYFGFNSTVPLEFGETCCGGFGPSLVSFNSSSRLFFAINEVPVIDISSLGNVGIGTTTPGTLFDIYSTASTTLRLDNNTSTKGGQVIVKDASGGTYTCIYTQAGTVKSKVAASPTSC